ncbi:MAG: hypothetical protein ABSG33_08420 [Candidatus Bathyarchaeia archaeon]|jgi:Gpi18-like mannosyltransferase
MKDVHKALTIALASRVLIIVVMVACSFLFAYATTEHLNVAEMKTPFVGLFMRWDSEFYLSIAQHGYPLGYPNIATFPTMTATGSPMPSSIAYPTWSFFPFYPAVMSALASLFRRFLSVTPSSLMLSGVIVSNVAFFVSAYFFYKLTQKLFNPRVALISTAFYSFWVGGVFFSEIYSEALFMALALCAFYFLEEKNLPAAVFLGFLASFTRSDGFLIFIPFFIYGSLQFGTSRIQSLKLFVSSAIVASPYLLFNIVGYFLAGGVFPVQLIARDSNWGTYPLLINQFVAPYCSVPSFQAFEIAGLILVLLPVAYAFSNYKKIFAEEERTLGYWAFYAAMVWVLFTNSVISNVLRYAVPMLPIYWVLAKIYLKNRLAGAVLFGVSTAMLIIAAYLLETANPNFM